MLWWFGDRAFEFAIRRLCTLHESQSGVRWTRRRGRPSQRMKEDTPLTQQIRSFHHSRRPQESQRFACVHLAHKCQRESAHFLGRCDAEDGVNHLEENEMKAISALRKSDLQCRQL